ncbi:ankyrin [Hypoxylon sp. NC0597]|nr:ankyrin [Hypoxylon sp. NC0597]
MHSQYEVVSMFLEESTSIFRGTSFGERAAAYARRHLPQGGLPDERATAILKKVIALDEDIDDYFPIHEAVRGYGDLVATLTQSSESINRLDSLGRTPLHWAIILDNVEAIRQLVAHGANPDTRDHRGITPLMVATWQARYDCIRGLIDAGCDVNITDGFGQSALCHALDSPVEGSAKGVGLLLDCGAQLAKVPSGFVSALDYLAGRPNATEIEEKFQLIFRTGDRSEGKNGDAVMRALAMNKRTLTRLMVDAGCKLNEAPGQRNALFTAAWHNNAENMAIFEEVKFMVDVRVRDDDGDTPLDIFNSKLESDPLLCTGMKIYPNYDDIKAFRGLLGSVRDLYLTTEIEILEIVVAHLKAQEHALARESLQHVIQEKLHWIIPAEYKTFRAIDVQIKEEMTEAAIESLEEFIEISRARIGTDPFDGDYCRRSSLEDQCLVILDLP